MKITVVIPTYNRGRYIGEAIESALGQMWPPDEVVVVDDGSTDETGSRLASYGSRIRVITTGNHGVAAARNAGIEAATGEWVAFLDSDDVWEAEKLAKQIEALKNQPDAGLSFTNRRPMDEDGRPLKGHHRSMVGGQVTRALFQSTFVDTPGVVVRKALLDTLGGFDESLAVCEDYELWLRASLYTPFVLVDEPLFRRRILTCSLSHSDDPDHHEIKCRMLETFSKHPLAEDRLPQSVIRSRLARVHFVAARAYREAGRHDRMKDHLREVTRLSPFHLRAWLGRIFR